MGYSDQTWFLCVSVRVFLMRLVFELGYNNVGEHYPIYGQLEQNKRQRGRRDSPPFPVPLFEMEHLMSCPQTGIYTTSHPGSQGFGLRLNYSTSFLGSLICRQHTVGLLNLHNCVSQFLITNLLIYV